MIKSGERNENERERINQREKQRETFEEGQKHEMRRKKNRMTRDTQGKIYKEISKNKDNNKVRQGKQKERTFKHS